MFQLQDAQKGADVSSEASERELELEAQLVEARSIIQEQVSSWLLACTNCLDEYGVEFCPMKAFTCTID